MTVATDSNRKHRQQVTRLVSSLASSTEALGVLAGVLDLRASGRVPPRPVKREVDSVLAALGLTDAIENLTRADLTAVKSLARARLLQALDLGEEMDREPGWRHTDAEMLESQGFASAAFAPVFKEALAPRMGNVEERLQEEGAAFLDVGVGVAGLAIAMCRFWPSITVVGIDIWEPALELARGNVEEAGLGAQIELRRQDVADLSDRDAYDLVWMPISFISPDALGGALRRLLEATRPGGWIIANAFGGADELSASLARLRAARAGGSVMSTEEMERALTAAGFEGVQSVPKEILPPVWMTVGRRGSGAPARFGPPRDRLVVGDSNGT